MILFYRRMALNEDIVTIFGGGICNVGRLLANGERGLFDGSISLDTHIVTICSREICIICQEQKEENGDVISQRNSEYSCMFQKTLTIRNGNTKKRTHIYFFVYGGTCVDGKL